jgi:hypothetical protein
MCSEIETQIGDESNGYWFLARGARAREETQVQQTSITFGNLVFDRLKNILL